MLFDIDCTKLSECTSLKDNLFDLVIFNFPHCGRKSGVKKNRELLKNFFLSCVQLLSEDGEVHVSLCNGQGGTPADQPKREWHNSWQVAAMAAEAHLILSDIQPFDSEKYQSYKCTGYRSQDKGFHVEKALLHVFTRSLPYTFPQKLTVEETVEGEKVQYQIPAELSDYMFREFLNSGSNHPVKLVQDFILKGLSEYCSVSMRTKTIPFILNGKQVQKYSSEADSTQCYLIHLLQGENKSENHSSADNKCTILHSYSLTDANDGESTMSKYTLSPEKMGKAQCKEVEVLKPVRSLDDDPEIETELHFLRPSLHAQVNDLINEDKILSTDCEEEAEIEGSETLNVEGHHCGRNGTVCSLLGISGVVFRNVPVNTWALPVFHELLLTGAFPSEPNPLKMFGMHLEKLLGPHGALLTSEEDELCLTAQPMGLICKIYAVKDCKSHSLINMCISLNLDLLAVLLFSIPDWRLLWSHDLRFINQFSVQPLPGTPYSPFSLFPQQFTFDISFWTGPTWDERKFYGVVREASCSTVQQVKLIDTFSHPDLSQTSYCYRLVYHSHTQALSHMQALLFHKRLENVLSSWLQVTIR